MVVVVWHCAGVVVVVGCGGIVVALVVLWRCYDYSTTILHINKFVVIRKCDLT